MCVMSYDFCWKLVCYMPSKVGVKPVCSLCVFPFLWYAMYDMCSKYLDIMCMFLHTYLLLMF